MGCRGDKNAVSRGREADRPLALYLTVSLSACNPPGIETCIMRRVSIPGGLPLNPPGCGTAKKNSRENEDLFIPLECRPLGKFEDRRCFPVAKATLP